MAERITIGTDAAAFNLIRDAIGRLMFPDYEALIALDDIESELRRLQVVEARQDSREAEPRGEA